MNDGYPTNRPLTPLAIAKRIGLWLLDTITGSSVDAAADLLVIHDLSTATNKKITPNELRIAQGLGTTANVQHGSLVLGTDPTGSELLRVGGNSVMNGSVVVSSTGATARASSLFIDQASTVKSRLFTLGSDASTTGEIEFLCLSSNASVGNSVLTLQALRITANSACVLQVANTTDATSATDTSASLNTAGGAAIGKSIYLGGLIDRDGHRLLHQGYTWTIRTSAADNEWFSVCYGNGLFVAVAVSGTGNRVMTSPDGITWTIRTSAADNQWLSVCYGNGLFVAVAITGTGNRVMTSPDGITWTIRTSAADNQWLSVCYGNGLFVAVANTGTGNRVMSSGYPDSTAEQKTVIRGYSTTDATDKDTGAIVTEGGVASEKAQFSQTGHNVANKFRIHYDSGTGEFGPQVKLTNKTGGNSVKGEIVRAATGTDMAFIQAPANSDEPIGVVYEAGVADASDAWIWTSGAVCQVLLKDGTASTRGNWAYVSDTAGRADLTNADPIGATEHTREIGHCLESKSSGTNVLARVTLHFN